MRFKRALAISVALSIVLHAVLLGAATQMQLPAIDVASKEPPRLFRIKTLEADLPERKTTGQQEPDYQKALRFESSRMDTQAVGEISRTLDVEHKQDFAPRVADIELAQVAQPVDLSDLLEPEKTEKVIQQKERRKTRTELVSGPGFDPASQPTGPSEESLWDEEVSRDFFGQMPGVTRKLKEAAADLPAIKGESMAGAGPKSVLQRQATFDDLHQHLSYDIYTYQDPEDSQKYFKISIRVGKEAMALPTIPKEIAFLVDCSISTRPKRLEEFKEGVKYSLAHLNPGDTFNILAFKKRTSKFQLRSIEPTADSVREALQFINDLSTGEKTDAFSALLKSININRRQTPSYVVFLSDGWPTQGVTNSRTIINEISRLNEGAKSIFAFSGGVRVNRYLLDFIAYKNRGWAEYAYRTHQISDGMAHMYDKIRDPILLNLRYRLSGLNPEHMFPKLLPDFFRHTEFTLFGKFTTEDRFLLQLLGDLQNNETKELIVEGDLRKASAGDAEIAKNWAFNKIYHLIGQLDQGQENRALLEEISRLSKKFGIRTPYSASLR